MTKAALRKQYKDKRSLLSEKDMLRLDDLLLIQFQQQPLGDVQTVLNYWPVSRQKEVNTHLMTDFLYFRIPSLEVAFPVIDHSSHIFKAIGVDETTEYHLNGYGIAEPVDGKEISPGDIDVVFVPLLAFDKKGFRVGYGKGFYDRFLATCRNDVLKIGFSYFDPEESIDDINEFDVPLNLCITPNNIYEF